MKKVRRFSYDGKQYLPGETLEIDPACFRSDFMVEVAEPVIEPIAEVAVEETLKEEGEPTSESKPASRKRRS